MSYLAVWAGSCPLLMSLSWVSLCVSWLLVNGSGVEIFTFAHCFTWSLLLKPVSIIQSWAKPSQRSSGGEGLCPLDQNKAEKANCTRHTVLPTPSLHGYSWAKEESPPPHSFTVCSNCPLLRLNKWHCYPLASGEHPSHCPLPIF